MLMGSVLITYDAPSSRSEPTRMVVTTRCPNCRDKTPIRVFAHELDAYADGAFMQEAFKDYHAYVREMLQTGYDPDCWDTMMAISKEED